MPVVGTIPHWNGNPPDFASAALTRARREELGVQAEIKESSFRIPA